MDLQAIGTFTLMVLLLTIMPGPNGALILKTVLKNGRRAGISNLLGIICAFSIHGILSMLGLSALIVKTSELFFIVKLMGSLYLLYLGATSLYQAVFNRHQPATIDKNENSRSKNRPGRSLFLEGFLTNMLNPKASMFYLAVFPQFIAVEGYPVLDSLLLIGIHSAVVAVWFSLVIIALGRMTRAVSSARFKRWVQGAVGSLMLWFGYRLLTYHQKN